ncbi:alpha/beta hydrolase [Chryseobacterium sp.]|uniref:alpha/beta hydrolase n=1 Tax=Chryseobacterium sp. TaxID=1871047 RepID=UPI0011CBF43B|nr:alpha/beta hydrolase [Chryseobacterium sp.]TXF77618.1 alpha/beta hydrolase [Chryseobacterium sp.]
MKKRILSYHFWLLGALSFFLNSCNTKHRIWMGEKGEQKIFNLNYGNDKRQVMDIFLPEEYNAEKPAVIIIHGGAWFYGRKEHMIKLQKLLFQNRIPTININYRLVNRNITYQQQLEDIKLAIEKFNSLSKKAKLQPNRYILLGESSGGHLALLYGYKNPEQVRKIISLSGPTDFFTKNFTDSFYSKYSVSTIQKMVGDKFHRTNISEAFKAASPIANVSNVPTLHFQGDQDVLVNKRQGLALDSVLTVKNIPHRFVYMKNTGHAPRFFNHKKRDHIIYPAILDFIKE